MVSFANRDERALTHFSVGFLIFISLFFFAFTARAENPSCTLRVPIEGAITPSTVDFFARAQAEAKKQNCVSILLTINTPGGALSSARSLVEKILASDIPVLCLVSPSGGHAGSAGALILLACHVNGALPATNIGAATPIAGGGAVLSDDLRQKIIQDTVSWAKGLARLRQRNMEFAETIITEARAVDATEAAKLGAIDVLAEDVNRFLDFAHTRTVTMDGGQTQLAQTGALIDFVPDLRTRVLQVLTDPELAYLIFMLSLGLVYFEITHPGTMAPGVVGGIGLLISLVAFQSLDVWWGGVGLIGLGLAMLALEAFLPSFGALGVGGILALGAGSLLLYEPGSPGLSIWLVGVVTFLLGSGMLALAVLAFRTKKLSRKNPGHDFTGRVGEVMSLEAPSLRRGMMSVEGEIWSFRCAEDVRLGEFVEILKQENMQLIVRRKL